MENKIKSLKHLTSRLNEMLDAEAYTVSTRKDMDFILNFLNTVDESDLEALIEETDDKKTESTITPEPTETDLTADKEQKTETPEKSEQPQKETTSNNGFLLVLLLLAGAAGVGVYYFKVVLPKKKLEQADDIEDFEFEEYDEDEETDIEDETEE